MIEKVTKLLYYKSTDIVIEQETLAGEERYKGIKILFCIPQICKKDFYLKY